MLSNFRLRFRSAHDPLSITLTLAGTLFFAFIMVRLVSVCQACLNPPDAYYVSWLMFSLILLSPVAYLVALLHKRSIRYPSKLIQSRGSRSLLFVVAMGLVASLSIVRFILESTPQGSDTPNYLYVSNLVLEKGALPVVIGDGRELTFLLLVVLRLLTEQVLHQPFQVSMMIFPVLLSNVIALATFQFVRTLSKDFELAVASMAFSGFSFFLIRMSYDLFAQMLGISLMLLLFSFAIKLMTGGLTRRSLTLVAILSAMLILAHAYTWILGMIILTFYVLTSRLEGKGIKMKALLATLLPGLAYFGMVRLASGSLQALLPAQWYERTLATPSVVQGILFPFQTGSFLPLDFSFLSSTTVGFENPLILTAAAIGAFALLRPNSEQPLPRLLFSWTASLGVLLLFGFSQQYRLIILLPIGILAGYAVTKISRLDVDMTGRLSRILSATGLTRRASGRAVIMLILICVCFAFSVPRAFAPQYVYYPSNQGIQQLLLARDLFGFGNPRILILVEDPGFVQNSFQWARAITGANVYEGSVNDLVAGKPFLLAGVVPVQPNLRTVDIIVIPPALYAVGSVDTGVFRNENGLYVTTPAVLMSSIAAQGN